ncbi:hypothetical protein D3C76_958200 [compost metagenome]
MAVDFAGVAIAAVQGGGDVAVGQAGCQLLVDPGVGTNGNASAVGVVTLDAVTAALCGIVVQALYP